MGSKRQGVFLWKRADSNVSKMELRIKRIIDLSLSSLLAVGLSPVYAILALLIKTGSEGPVIFRQERIGKEGIPFAIYKFRTMEHGVERETIGRYLHATDPHITGLGRSLRRWGLDELPQVFNILKGEMSLVGPRPTLRYQVEKYDETQRLRLKMKPGLTGWAQVNGRNKLNWRQRLDYDIWYVENWSLLLDLKIILLTPGAILRREFAFADEAEQDDIVALS